jgi:cell division protein FtsN
MAKQYRRRNTAASGRGLLRSLMLVCVSFFSGYLVASYLDVARLGNWLSSLAPESSRLVPTPQLASHTQKPKLEFYTLLTANHGAVAIPPRPAPIVAKGASVAHTTVATQRVAPATTLLAHETKPEVKSVAQKASAAKLGYTIQVAALRTQQDAERMKASLLLRGFQVNVSSIASNDATWYRVMVGPCASRAQAEETQSVLVHRERMNGMIRTLDRTA